MKKKTKRNPNSFSKGGTLTLIAIDDLRSLAVEVECIICFV